MPNPSGLGVHSIKKSKMRSVNWTSERLRMALLFSPRSMSKFRRQMSHKTSLSIITSKSVCSSKKCAHKTVLYGSTMTVETCGQAHTVVLGFGASRCRETDAFRSRTANPEPGHTILHRTPRNLDGLCKCHLLCAVQDEIRDLVRVACLPRSKMLVACSSPKIICSGERAAGKCQCAL